MNKVFAFLLKFTPFALLAGLLDYRFHNYYWAKFDRLRFGKSPLMFDFMSGFELFVMVIGVGVLAFCIYELLFSRRQAVRLGLAARSAAWWGKTKVKKDLWLIPSIALIAIGIIVAGAHYEAVEPFIKSFSDQVLTNYILPVVLFFSLFALIKKSPKKSREAFEKAFLLAFTLLGMLCFFEFFTDVLPGENRDFLNRLVWPYIDPFVEMKAESANWLAFLFGPTALLAAVRLSRIKKMAPIELAALLVSLAVLGLSRSYTGILVTGAILGYLLLLSAPKLWKKWVVLAGVLILAVGIATQYNTPKFQILIGNYDYSLPNSVERRSQIYEVTWESFKERPLQGIGAGNFQSYFRENQERFLEEPIPEIEMPPHPHNLLAKWWSDIGLFGLLALLLIYGKTLWEVFWRRENLYFLVLAYPLAHGLFDTPYGAEEASMLFWIFMMLAFNSSMAARVSK